MIPESMMRVVRKLKHRGCVFHGAKEVRPRVYRIDLLFKKPLSVRFIIDRSFNTPTNIMLFGKMIDGKFYAIDHMDFPAPQGDMERDIKTCYEWIFTECHKLYKQYIGRLR